MGDGSRHPLNSVRVESDDGGGIGVVVVVGEHDMASETALAGCLEEMRVSERGVVLDLSEATFLDLAMLRVVFTAHHRARSAGHRLVIQWADGDGDGDGRGERRVFELTGLLARLDQASSRGEATALAGRDGA